MFQMCGLNRKIQFYHSKNRPFFETINFSKISYKNSFFFRFIYLFSFKIVFETVNNDKSQNIHQ